MSYSKNYELMAKDIFTSIARIKDFKTIDYAYHRGVGHFCDCFKFEFSVESGNSQKMDEYLSLNLNRIYEFEKTQKDNEITYIVEVNKQKIKYCFNALYHPNLSKITLDDVCIKSNSPAIKVLLYKLVNEEIIRRKIIDNDNNICEFIENNPDIERALYLSIGSTYYTIEGTGCSCSQIEPLLLNEFDAKGIFEHFNKLRS